MNSSKYCKPIGDRGIYVDLSNIKEPLKKVHELADYLRLKKMSFISDIIPGLNSILIRFKCNSDISLFRNNLLQEIEKITADLIEVNEVTNAANHKKHKIKVCYHTEVALDLADAASSCNMTTDEFINLHKSQIYTVDIVGFMPGFAYFSGLNPKLKLPRKASPRPSVPKGSVAIADLQTAIYPRSTPGGWNIIGKSPDTLFSVENNPPSLFSPGDQLFIEEISLDELHRLELKNHTQNSYRFSQSLDNQKHAIQILIPGLLTSIQDYPREGLAHLAVGTGGAVDQPSMAIANALVGNPINTEVLEITSTGPKILFKQDSLIAWVGTNCQAKVNNIEVKGNRPVWIKQNNTLTFSILKPGFRITLAVSGGFDIPTCLEKKGSHLSADIGFPALKKMDVIPLKDPSNFLNTPVLAKLSNTDNSVNYTKWGVPPPYLPNSGEHLLHALPGVHLKLLSKADQSKFWESTWTISNQSNRMGIRLESDFQPSNLPKGILSQGISMGSIQLPPSNQPIILFAEHQTTGGYPLLADIIQADFSILAQLKPGDKVRLEQVTLETADELNVRNQRHIENIIDSINNNYRDSK